jgi:hypothetical protein
MISELEISNKVSVSENRPKSTVVQLRRPLGQTSAVSGQTQSKSKHNVVVDLKIYECDEQRC